MRLKEHKNIYDFLFFQSAWLICVLVKSELALLVILPFLILHQSLSENWRRDLRTGLTFAFIGALAESIMLGSGSFVIDHITQYFPPLWLITMWFCFGITTHHSLLWLRYSAMSNPLSIGLIGATLSPLAYLGAERLGAIELAKGGLWAVSLSWAVALPLAILMTRFSKEEAI